MTDFSLTTNVTEYATKELDDLPDYDDAYYDDCLDELISLNFRKIDIFGKSPEEDDIELSFGERDDDDGDDDDYDDDDDVDYDDDDDDDDEYEYADDDDYDDDDDDIDDDDADDDGDDGDDEMLDLSCS